MILVFLVIFFLFFLPGIILSFVLLNGKDFNFIDKTSIGLFIGLFAIPVLSFIEFHLFNLFLSFDLVFINSALLYAFCWLAVVQLNKPIELRSKQGEIFSVIIAVLFLYIFMVFANPTVSYDANAATLVNNGHVELSIFESYYPFQYVVSSWMTTRDGFQVLSFSKDVLVSFSQFYVRIFCLIIFYLMFLLIRRRFFDKPIATPVIATEVLRYGQASG